MKRLNVGRFPSAVKHDTWLGLCCLPALLLIFITGYKLGYMHQASIIASGAITLAYGANKTWEDSSIILLLSTVLGVVFSTWFGSLTGNDLPLYIGGAMLYSGAYAMLAGIQSGLWWALLQCTIAYLVSGYFAGSAEHAVQRALLVGIGGLVQIFCLALCFSKMRFEFQDFTRLSWVTFFRQATHNYQQKIHLGWSVFFAMLMMGIALSAVETYAVGNGYWAGMTLLLCLRTNFRESLRRIPARILGTLSGSLVATILLDHMNTPLLLAIGFILSGYIAFTASYTLVSRSYFVFTFFVTVMVIFMMSNLGISQHDVIANRMISTIVGGLCALVAILLTRVLTDFHMMQKLKKHAPKFAAPTRYLRRK